MHSHFTNKREREKITKIKRRESITPYISKIDLDNIGWEDREYELNNECMSQERIRQGFEKNPSCLK